MHPYRSAVEGVHWPALPTPEGAQLLALLEQFAQSERLSPQALLERQFRQLRVLLAHAGATVPYYRAAFARAGVDVAQIRDPETFRRLPILTRATLQEQGEALRGVAPPAHGPLHPIQTSGSTGMPVKTVGTGLTRRFWHAFTLREHVWQRRDFSASLASIRTEGNELGPEGGINRGWGGAAGTCFVTGPGLLLGLRTPVDAQLRWLARHNPAYLLSHPSNLRALLDLSERQQVRLPGLRQVRSFGETLNPELRVRCRVQWGVEIADVYSSQEVGYIALQCPRHEHYHVQAEGVYVEVLDAQDRPCAPGEIGRVVITTLHNHAAPLIRYAIGDYAEAGAPCDCGRNLPVLTRILGRQRNILTLPDGRQLWPSFPAKLWLPLAPIRQLQLVQQDLHTLEVRAAADRPFTAAEEQRLREFFAQRFGYPFAVRITRAEAFERAPNCKFEDFVSKVS